MRKQTKVLKSHFQKDKENNHGNEWGKKLLVLCP